MTAQPAATSSGVMNEGSQPSPSRPMRRSSTGTRPPSHTSNGSWWGVTLSRTPSRGKHGPSWCTGSPDHSRRMRGSASSTHAARSLRATPKAACSRGSTAPRPTAGWNRPPDSRSRLAISLARTTGFRPGRTSTPVPNRSRRLRPAAMAMAMSGSGPGR